MQPTPDFSDHAASVEPNRHKEQTMDSFMDSLQQGGVGLGIQGIQQFQDLFARVGSPEQPSDQNGLLHPDSALRQDQSYFPSPESELAATPKPSKRNTRKRSASVTSYYSDNEDGYQESHTGLVKRGHHAGTPPAGPFHQQPTILILPSISTLSGLPVNLRLLISCSRAFFKEQTEGDWLIYRRNYLELRCAVEAADSLGVATESLSVEVDGERKEVKKLWAEVRAVDGKNQSVELIQGTSTVGFGFVWLRFEEADRMRCCFSHRREPERRAARSPSSWPLAATHSRSKTPSPSPKPAEIRSPRSPTFTGSCSGLRLR